ncbi:hypothetical protein J23TS9_21950 [Paenibacillus sp. J23TS9]|nr:hypothetical protein J23TS9_21950 [Paenibacillus sp. J23TS9]
MRWAGSILKMYGSKSMIKLNIVDKAAGDRRFFCAEMIELSLWIYMANKERMYGLFIIHFRGGMAR